ncbi:NAD-binding protein [Aporhodopirellula aestuarii]|uniref:NAD-binding protein n=1 Tax=Aporhodopirellula aestuarii TaxID=2950107 RepID=A0ABT0TXN9_9BACT|nr:NAD-binding protein [Aporhodopirellula aestuarii]MCM2369023.1 NAD-binding protein [Aporhodopirellula aestuarii]
MKESARYLLPILFFVALVLSVGTGGFLLLEEGISVHDAFYMAVTAITPTQFHEVHKLSIHGRYFTVVLVFCGFGAVVAFATQFARLIVQSELEGVGIFTQKQMRRRIRMMKNHYIVCGFGEIGGAICGELVQQQLPFVVITADKDSTEVVEREGYAIVKGNPTADTSLKEAGIEHASGVIAVLADDADNLFISLAARELNPKILIIARGEDSSVEDRILRAGADIVVSPMKLGGQQIANLIRQQDGSSSPGESSLSSVGGFELASFKNETRTPISVAQVLKECGAIGLCGIEHVDGAFESDSSVQTRLGPGETLVMYKRVRSTEDFVNAVSQPRTVLLADDHRALRLLFSRKLIAAGYDVIQAENGLKALELAKLQQPELIVLDVNMPQLSGYQVAAALRKDARFDEVPIILYSADEANEFLHRGKEAGADMCIRKTSKSSELLACIEEAFAKKRESHASRKQPSANQVASEVKCEDQSDTPSEFSFEGLKKLTGDDPKLMDELIKAMLDETPRLLQELEYALDQNDVEQIRSSTHTLKGSLDVFGASGLHQLATELESIAAGDELDAVHPVYREFKRRCEALIDQLSAILQRQ